MTFWSTMWSWSASLLFSRASSRYSSMPTSASNCSFVKNSFNVFASTLPHLEQISSLVSVAIFILLFQSLRYFFNSLPSPLQILAGVGHRHFCVAVSHTGDTVTEFHIKGVAERCECAPEYVPRCPLAPDQLGSRFDLPAF